MLTVRKPTSSTILYTVSTRTSAKTFGGHAFNALVILARILAAVVALGIIWIEYERTTSAQDGLGHLLIQQNSRLEQIDKLSKFTQSTHTSLLRLAVSLSLIWLVCRRGYTEESLLVIRGLGVQTSTSSSTYLWSSSTRFISTTAVQDILIHEAFIGFKIKFYLAIVVENETEVLVVFPNILPKLDTLEKVWRGARACLYEPKT